MTGALLAVRTEPARAIILDNLLEEVRDSHPHMLRKFALAAHALPTDLDAMDVYRDLTKVRLFLGQLSAVRIIAMMAFFEGFIQRFMAYLADLAERQGSTELEYTDVHGVCDIAHTEGLFRALEAEMILDPSDLPADQFEGVSLLRTLLRTIVDPTGTEKTLSQFAGH
jgi:Iron-containing redox enzyme